MPSINVASPDCAEAFFAGRAVRCVNLWHAGSLAELRSVLGHHLHNVESPATLDRDVALFFSNLPVFGTLKPLLKSHSDANCFNPAFSHILIEASAIT